MLEAITLQHSNFIPCHIDVAPRSLFLQSNGYMNLLDYRNADFNLIYSILSASSW